MHPGLEPLGRDLYFVNPFRMPPRIRAFLLGTTGACSGLLRGMVFEMTQTPEPVEEKRRIAMHPDLGAPYGRGTTKAMAEARVVAGPCAEVIKSPMRSGALQVTSTYEGASGEPLEGRTIKVIKGSDYRPQINVAGKALADDILKTLEAHPDAIVIMDEIVNTDETDTTKSVAEAPVVIGPQDRFHPPLLLETARERKNRLARERRAAKKAGEAA
jgi:hypothetical protein